jgi:tetratricopeptide (TPR) repeat protein
MDLAANCWREQRFDEAARSYRQALENYRQKADARRAAAAMTGLGRLLSARHRYPEAGDLLEQALAILERDGSRDSYAAGQIKKELAAVRAAEKRTGEAAALYREALEILEPALGPENPRLLAPLASYSKTLRAQDDYVGAARVDFEIMKICVKQTLREGKQSAFGGAIEACSAPKTLHSAEGGSDILINVAGQQRLRGF